MVLCFPPTESMVWGHKHLRNWVEKRKLFDIRHLATVFFLPKEMFLAGYSFQIRQFLNSNIRERTNQAGFGCISLYNWPRQTL